MIYEQIVLIPCDAETSNEKGINKKKQAKKSIV